MSWPCRLDGGTRNTYRILMKKLLGKRSFGSPRSRWDDGVRWTELFQDRLQWRPHFGIRDTETSGSTNGDSYCRSGIGVRKFSFLIPLLP
jgi:hypothetical protein